jgi:hypothetical protein
VHGHAAGAAQPRIEERVAGGLEFDIFDGESDPVGVVKTILARAASPPAPSSPASTRASWRSPDEKRLAKVVLSRVTH